DESAGPAVDPEASGNGLFEEPLDRAAGRDPAAETLDERALALVRRAANRHVDLRHRPEEGLLLRGRQREVRSADERQGLRAPRLRVPGEGERQLVVPRIAREPEDVGRIAVEGGLQVLGLAKDPDRRRV